MAGFDMGSLMRTQLFSMGMMKDDSNMITLIFGLFLMTLLDLLVKALPKITEKAHKIFNQYVQKKTNDMLSTVIDEKCPRAFIKFERLYDEQNNLQFEIVDALLDYISNLNSVGSLSYSGFYMIYNKKEFILTKNIYAKLLNIDIDKDSIIESIEFTIYSYEMELNDLKNWVDKIHRSYIIQKKNNLGNKKYYFNEIVHDIVKDIDGNYMLQNAPKRLNFTMTEFLTNKNLDNIFGPHIKNVKKRVDLFINHPEWYEKRGIPHTLGLMLHGTPGTGKTSIIKAIAKYTNRHIINLSLRKTTTQTQLNNLFYDENLSIVANQETQNIIIPPEQRIYVIEDIDCLTDVVLDRNINEEPEVKEVKELPRSIESGSEPLSSLDSMFVVNSSMLQNHRALKNNKATVEYSTNDQLTLSYLLNLLDGVLEIPGRILIITSNYPEKIDKALIRPGRVDLSISFKNADVEMIYDMLNHFYPGMEFDKSSLAPIEHKMTPAQVINVLCRYYEDGHGAVKELLANSNEY